MWRWDDGKRRLGTPVTIATEKSVEEPEMGASAEDIIACVTLERLSVSQGAIRAGF